MAYTPITPTNTYTPASTRVQQETPSPLERIADKQTIGSSAVNVVDLTKTGGVMIFDYKTREFR